MAPSPRRLTTATEGEFSRIENRLKWACSNDESQSEPFVADSSCLTGICPAASREDQAEAQASFSHIPSPCHSRCCRRSAAVDAFRPPWIDSQPNQPIKAPTWNRWGLGATNTHRIRCQRVLHCFDLVVCSVQHICSFPPAQWGNPY